eukprot:2973848-Amphidinium_carterae.1
MSCSLAHNNRSTRQSHSTVSKSRSLNTVDTNECTCQCAESARAARGGTPGTSNLLPASPNVAEQQLRVGSESGGGVALMAGLREISTWLVPTGCVDSRHGLGDRWCRVAHRGQSSGCRPQRHSTPVQGWQAVESLAPLTLGAASKVAPRRYQAAGLDQKIPSEKRLLLKLRLSPIVYQGEAPYGNLQAGNCLHIKPLAFVGHRQRFEPCVGLKYLKQLEATSLCPDGIGLEHTAIIFSLVKNMLRIWSRLSL